MRHRLSASPAFRVVPLTVLLGGLLCGSSRSDSFDINQFTADLAGALAKECPMSSVDDVAAQEACRKNIGQGPESRWRNSYVLFGGEQPHLYWLRDKKTSVFRGDVFEDLYMSLYMYTGKFHVSDEADGLKVITVEAYFRNGLPPGRYPYPFWHSANKWQAYEKSNELRFRVTTTGKVEFAYRADTGSDADRPPGYAHVERPPFVGAWTWRDDKGGAQPEATLFSELYSSDNPNLHDLDTTYVKMALSFRDADCTVCHQPEGHGKMNKLVLLQTPVHAASHIDAVLHEIRAGKMPEDDYGDPMMIDASLKTRLLTDGEAFKNAIDAADAWERDNHRPKARPVSTDQ